MGVTTGGQGDCSPLRWSGPAREPGFENILESVETLSRTSEEAYGAVGARSAHAAAAAAAVVPPSPDRATQHKGSFRGASAAATPCDQKADGSRAVAEERDLANRVPSAVRPTRSGAQYNMCIIDWWPSLPAILANHAHNPVKSITHLKWKRRQSHDLITRSERTRSRALKAAPRSTTTSTTHNAQP